MSTETPGTAKVCVISTGGTISSVYDPVIQSLRPGLAMERLIDSLPKGLRDIEVIQQELFQIDSANAQPRHWVEIAVAIKEAYENIPDLSGVVVTHGTDTMVYSASAISFMVQDFGRPIVFTGSQIPASIPWSDGPRNLLDAIRLAAWADFGETCIVFNSEIHRPTRTKKVRVNSYDAFDSVDPTPVGVLARDIIFYHRRRRRDISVVPRFDTRLDSKVFLLKVFPGMPPGIIPRIIDMGYHGVVVEGFGSGNIPTNDNALTGAILQVTSQGSFVVISSQCAFGQVDLSLYEVGRAALEVGAMSGGEMTSEATLVKLAWVLGHSRDPQRVAEMMSVDYAGETAMTMMKEPEGQS